MKLNSIGFLVTATLIAFAATALNLRAQILVDYTPDYSNTTFSLYADNTTQGQRWAAEDFTLNSASTVTSIQFSGYYSSNPTTLPTDTFTAAIYTDQVSGTTLGTLVSTLTFTLTRTASGSSTAGAPIENYTLTLDTPLNLAGGEYYLKLYDNSSPSDDWVWLGSKTGTGNAAFYTVGANFLIASPTDLALQINGTAAPEPSTWAMLIAGVALLGWRRTLTQTRKV